MTGVAEVNGGGEDEESTEMMRKQTLEELQMEEVGSLVLEMMNVEV